MLCIVQMYHKWLLMLWNPFLLVFLLVYSWSNDVNMSSINSSNNSRKAQNPHKSGLFLQHGLTVSWKANEPYSSGYMECHIVSVGGNALQVTRVT